MLTDYLNRILADQRDQEAWHAARGGDLPRIGASDAAKYAIPTSIQKYVRAKLMPSWEGGLFAQWGHEREPVILTDHGWDQNHFFIASEHNDRFGATPDAINHETGRLAQVKTSVHPLKIKDGMYQVTPAHLRQMWWEQFVMGPEYRETDYIHEVYELNGAGEPVPAFESTVITVHRDEEQIALMAAIATEVLSSLDDAKAEFLKGN